MQGLHLTADLSNCSAAIHLLCDAEVLRGHCLELVKAVQEISRLMELSRAYQNVSSLMQRTDEIRRSAISRLADVNNNS